MCGACGVLGGGAEWLDRAGHPDGIDAVASLTRVAERQRRIALVNLLLGSSRIRLSDLGNRMAVHGPTGRTEIVDSLMHVWAAADRMRRAPIDPLDESLLRRLAGT
jgi:hypothetical protein